MGHSTDGIIFYGVAFGEDEHPEQFESDEALAGFLEKKDEVSYGQAVEILEKHGIELVTYCSGSYPMFGLAVFGTKKTVPRGYTVELGQIIETPEHSKLDKILTMFKIDKKPEWLLVSYESS